MKLDFKNTFFLLDMFLIVGGEGSSNRNASRDESVEAGDKSVEAGDESIEAGEKTPQSCYKNHTKYSIQLWQYMQVKWLVKFATGNIIKGTIREKIANLFITVDIEIPLNNVIIFTWNIPVLVLRIGGTSSSRYPVTHS